MSVTETLWKCPTCGASSLIATVDLPHVICVGCDNKEKEQSRVPIGETLVCEHRSENFKSVWCSPCRGSIKVFKCDIHGMCTIGKKMEGIACCNNKGRVCSNYNESPT